MSATTSQPAMATCSVAFALLPIMAVVLVAFLVVGLALPVLPLHVHQSLGLGAFSDHADNTEKPIRAVDFDEEISDPGWITYVKLPRSGSINFKSTCGAYATNTFTGPPLGCRYE